MSANNQIIIKKKGDKWRADDYDIDSGRPMFDVCCTETLEDAIRSANEYMQENEVEYGYRIILPDKK